MGRRRSALAGRYGREQKPGDEGRDRRGESLGVFADQEGGAAGGQESSTGEVASRRASWWLGSRRRGSSLSPPASKRTLIRRATVDLWGIPPSAAEVDAFDGRRVAGGIRTGWSTGCWRRRGTASAGDGTGSMSHDMLTRRDMFSRKTGAIRMPIRTATTSSGRSTADLGYDQFVVQQLAADYVAGGKDRGALAAMGFLTVGRRFLLDQNEIIDDRIDVVTRGFLGLTVTCARCHDHKFDPIPAEDYYSLYGVFASSVEPAELPMLSDPAANPRFAEYQKKLAVVTKARDDYLAARRDEFAGEMKANLSQVPQVGAEPWL